MPTKTGMATPKLALRFLSTALHQCAHTVGLGQDVDGVVVNLLAEVGDGELVGVLAKQLDAEVGLELGELAADGGFGHPEQCRRFRKAATFHHLAEYQQGVDVEGQVLFHDWCSKYATGCCGFAAVLTIFALLASARRRAS